MSQCGCNGHDFNRYFQAEFELLEECEVAFAKDHDIHPNLVIESGANGTDQPPVTPRPRQQRQAAQREAAAEKKARFEERVEIEKRKENRREEAQRHGFKHEKRLKKMLLLPICLRFYHNNNKLIYYSWQKIPSLSCPYHEYLFKISFHTCRLTTIADLPSI